MYAPILILGDGILLWDGPYGCATWLYKYDTCAVETSSIVNQRGQVGLPGCTIKASARYAFFKAKSFARVVTPSTAYISGNLPTVDRVNQYTRIINRTTVVT